MENTPRRAPQGGEIVSDYSNAWIDMRHDNALNSTALASKCKRGQESARPRALLAVGGSGGC
jgi:hypothetical protein